MRLFAKEFASFLGAEYFVRGKSSISDLIANARYSGSERIYILTEKHGNPHQLLELEILPKKWEFKDTYLLKLIKLRKELSKEKFRVRSVNIDLKNNVFNKLLRSAKVFSELESKFIIKEKDNRITMYVDGKEIGPRFEIEWSSE